MLRGSVMIVSIDCCGYVVKSVPASMQPRICFVCIAQPKPSTHTVCAQVAARQPCACGHVQLRVTPGVWFTDALESSNNKHTVCTNKTSNLRWATWHLPRHTTSTLCAERFPGHAHVPPYIGLCQTVGGSPTPRTSLSVCRG